MFTAFLNTSEKCCTELTECLELRKAADKRGVQEL